MTSTDFTCVLNMLPRALDRASGVPVAEGSVGGGTGMICFEFKCGIGTSSRIAAVDGESYTLGVLVQANFGRRGDLRIAGVPVGRKCQATWYIRGSVPISK